MQITRPSRQDWFLFLLMLLLIPLAGEPKIHPFGGDFASFRVSFGSPLFLLFLLLLRSFPRVLLGCAAGIAVVLFRMALDTMRGIPVADAFSLRSATFFYYACYALFFAAPRLTGLHVYEQALAVDDPGQAGREHGQQEAVDAQGDQDEGVDADPHAGGLHDQCGGDDEAGAQEVARQEGLAPSPPVDEGPGEGADDAEGQEHDDQGGGDVARARGVLGSEEEEGDQAHLDHAVTGLGDEAGGQEDPQAARGGQIPQVVSQSHAPRLRAQGSRSRMVLVGYLPQAGAPLRPDGRTGRR